MVGCIREVVGCIGRVWLCGRCGVVWGGSRKRSLVVDFSCVHGCLRGLSFFLPFFLGFEDPT